VGGCRVSRVACRIKSEGHRSTQRFSLVCALTALNPRCGASLASIHIAPANLCSPLRFCLPCSVSLLRSVDTYPASFPHSPVRDLRLRAPFFVAASSFIVYLYCADTWSQDVMDSANISRLQTRVVETVAAYYIRTIPHPAY